MWGTPTRKPHYLNSYDSVTLLEEALKNDGLPSQYSASDIEMYRKSCAGELTSFMVMGMEGAKQILKKHPDLCAYLIYADEKGLNKIWYSPSLKNKINCKYLSVSAHLSISRTNDFL